MPLLLSLRMNLVENIANSAGFPSEILNLKEIFTCIKKNTIINKCAIIVMRKFPKRAFTLIHLRRKVNNTQFYNSHKPNKPVNIELTITHSGSTTVFRVIFICIYGGKYNSN